MLTGLDDLIELLGTQSKTAHLTGQDWTRLLAIARETHLLGKLAAALSNQNVLPEGNPTRHLVGALMLSRRQRQSVTWEAHELDRALAKIGTPVVFLKGAAYALGGFASADGRLFGDIDLLVPSELIGNVEIQLMIHGWESMKLDAYDQRYYRKWMHEIPPMMHVRRGTVLDVHHTILPLTARYRPDPGRILDAATPLKGFRCLHVPAPEDLVIHSCCHLVHEGEVDKTLRDAHDIATLVTTHFGNADARKRFSEAAREHQLLEPTCLALTLVLRYFRCPEIPPLLDTLGGSSWRTRNGRIVERYVQALAPSIETPPTLRKLIARQLIYVRAHRLRMPVHMLVRHLARKAWMRWREYEQTSTDEK